MVLHARGTREVCGLYPIETIFEIQSAHFFFFFPYFLLS